MTVVIVDYGAGNLTSVVKALTAVGATPLVATEARQLVDARALVVPGVGHFASTAPLGGKMRQVIKSRIVAGVPMLGICLGMQWLFEGSEEAQAVAGLGILPGRCARLSGRAGVKVPHVGWNTIDRDSDDHGADSRLLRDVPAGASAYFTHSYAAPDGASTVARTTHGVSFASVVERGCVFGTQFHPEKSGTTGLAILAAFVQIAHEAGRC